MLKVDNLQIDYLKEPMGVTETPQFSWCIISNKRNVRQTFYQLQIANCADFTSHLVYDSGLIYSEQSTQVIPEGFALEEGRRYYVRVRISDGTKESAYCSPASFVSGILDPSSWHAQFVSAENEDDALSMKSTLLKGEFIVKKKIQEAYAFTTALGLYQFYINGEKVGTDELAPGWTSYNKRLLYQTHDISKCLEQGDNTFGAMLGAGWYKGKMGFLSRIHNYGKQTAFFCQILIRYEDGSSQTICSDESMVAFSGPVLFAEIYDGEIYDNRIPDLNKITRSQNDLAIKAVNVIPFSTTKLFSQSGCRVRIMEELPVQTIYRTPKGEQVIDFGQNLTGWISFKVNGQSGDKVILQCFETLDAKGNVYLDNLRLAKQTIQYICSGEGTEEYHPNFTYQGFRYAHIISYPGLVEQDNFKAQVLYSEMEETGTFTCSNLDLNQLQHNIAWSLRGNFLDIPSDCPQRNERVGWTGDAQIFAPSASFLHNTYTFFSKWLKDLAADQTPEGGVSHLVPDIITGIKANDWLVSQGTHSAAGWADAAVIIPWTLYQAYGDTKILANQYSSMKAWIDFMNAHKAENGIWSYRLQFGDWVALDADEGSYFGATPTDFTCAVYFAYSTRLFTKIAGILERKEDEKKYRLLYLEAIKTFQNTFLDETGTLSVPTQTAHILALYFELVPTKYKEQVARSLATLLEKENGHLVTGFLGTPYFCHALSQNGLIKEAYELLLKDDFPSWLYQVKAGATTIWEHWDGIKPDGTMWSPDMNSFNHYAYGAIGAWLYGVVAGIQVAEDAPGYKRSIIAPHIGGGLTYVEATHKSLFGVISVRWKVDEQNIVDLHVQIPPNTTSIIQLTNSNQVLESDGVVFTKQSEEYIGEVGSGEYHFKYSSKP